jgi:hypothetical protein
LHLADKLAPLRQAGVKQTDEEGSKKSKQKETDMTEDWQANLLISGKMYFLSELFTVSIRVGIPCRIGLGNRNQCTVTLVSVLGF